MTDPESTQNTGTLRDLAFQFFEYQPLNKTIIDPYNDMVINGLPETLEVPLFYETESKFGMVKFKRVIPIPPYEGTILPPPNVERVAELRKQQEEEYRAEEAEFNEIAELEQKIVKLEEKHKRELEILLVEGEGEEIIEEVTSKQEEAVELLRAKAKELQAKVLRNAHEGNIIDLMARHDQENEKLEEMGEKLKILAEQLDAELSDIRNTFQAEIDELNSDAQAKIEELSSEAKDELEERPDDEDEILTKLQAEIDKVSGKTKAEVDAILVNMGEQIEERTAGYKGTVGDLDKNDKEFSSKNVELAIIAHLAEKKKEQNAELHQALLQMYGGIPPESWLTAARARQRGRNYMLAIYADIQVTEYEKRTNLEKEDEENQEENHSKKLLPGDEEDPNAEIPSDRFLLDKFVNMNITLSNKRELLFPSVHLFDIPLMVGSAWDWLNIGHVPKQQWNQYQECDLSPLCNFIMAGKEKAFVTQIKSSHNEPRCVLEKAPSKVPIVIADLRCSTHSRRSNLIRLKFIRPLGKNDIKDTKICYMIMPFMKDEASMQKRGAKESKPTFNVLWVFRFYVIWYYLDKLGEAEYFSSMKTDKYWKSSKLMLSEFNRVLLDVTSDGQQQGRDVTTYRRIVEHLIDTIGNATDYDAGEITSDYDFILFLQKYTKGVVGEDLAFGVRRMKMLFDAQFMPHIICPEYGGPDSPTLYPRFIALVQMLVKYVKCYVGVKALDDRDSVEEQQLATAGMEIGVLVKKGFGKVKARLRNWLIKNTDEKYLQLGEQVRNAGVSLITSQLTASFRTGNWGLDGGGKKRPGVVQMHETASILSQWNMVRKSSIPADKNSNIEKPRRVHHTTYCIFDPTNTPDNEAVGLNRSLCLSAYVTSDNPSAYKEVVNYLQAEIEAGKEAFETRGEGPDKILMACYLDNVFICYATRIVYEAIRKLKLNGNLGNYTEVYVRKTVDEWQEIEEIRIRTNAGRAMRPLLLVLGEIGSQEIPALELFRSSTPLKPIGFGELLAAGVAEFVSPGEFQEAEVAINYAHFVKGCQSGRKFTYIELDPYMAMSVEVATQPFPGLNPNPRVLYYAAMSRQPLSIPFATYRTRQETEIRVLNYVHKPLVTTDIIKILGLDQQGFGTMVYCAIKSKKATDEDSTVWKKSFFERGGMQGTIYNTYTITAATTVGDDTEKEKDNPAIYEKGLIRVRRDNTKADILDEDEVDIKTTEIDELRAKEFAEAEESKEYPFPEGVERLRGNTNVLIRPKELLARYRAKQEVTADVEKLRLAGKRSGFVTLTDISGTGAERQQKIVVRFPHYPRQGDKFANRYAQKGVTGDVIPDRDMPFVVTPAGNIIPDVIFSPTSFTSRMTAGMIAEMWAGQAIVAPDTRRFVKNLLKWNRGDSAPVFINEWVQETREEEGQSYEFKPHAKVPSKRGAEMREHKGELYEHAPETDFDTIKRDFWIPLVPAMVKSDVSGQGAQEFKLISRMQEEARDKQREINTPKRTEEEARNSKEQFGGDAGWEALFEEELAAKMRERWRRVYGLVISKNIAQEEFVAPTQDCISTLKTMEKAVLFSQLPDNYQIAWYLENLERIIPLYMFRFPESWPEENSEELSDASAFRDPDYLKIAQTLKSRGFASKGSYKMTDGQTGQQSDVTIFAAPIYWMQLRHLTDSKYQVRDQGSMSISSRSAAKGKAVGGAVRSGELSHSALLAHGAMDYLAERFMTAADQYEIMVCGNCGEQCYRVSRNAAIVCDRCGGQPVVPRIMTVPYSGMRLISMLTAAGVRPRIQTLDDPRYKAVPVGQERFKEPENNGPHILSKEK